MFKQKLKRKEGSLKISSTFSPEQFLLLLLFLFLFYLLLSLDVSLSHISSFPGDQWLGQVRRGIAASARLVEVLVARSSVHPGWDKSGEA